jgi:hypothetical protein
MANTDGACLCNALKVWNPWFSTFLINCMHAACVPVYISRVDFCASLGCGLNALCANACGGKELLSRHGLLRHDVHESSCMGLSDVGSGERRGGTRPCCIGAVSNRWQS